VSICPNFNCFWADGDYDWAIGQVRGINFNIADAGFHKLVSLTLGDRRVFLPYPVHYN
jgi:hypothetical protein